MDGAHTHRHGPSGPGIGAALLIGAGLALAAPIAHAVAAIVSTLLISLAVVVVLAVTGLTACAVIGYRRRHEPYRPLRSGPDPVPLAGHREVVSLRQAITELHAQLAAARDALAAGPRPDAQQHLHIHGLDPAQVAAILAAYRRQPGDDQ